MEKKLIGKILTDDQAKNKFNDFDADAYRVCDTAEVIVSAAQAREYIARKQSELASANAFVDALEEILSSREFGEDDKICVTLNKDDVVEVVNGDQSTYETTEVLASQEVRSFVVSYVCTPVSEYNELCNTNLTDEGLLLVFARKLLELHFGHVLKYCKKKLSEFDSVIANEIIDKNNSWNTLLLIKVDAGAINKLLPEQRQPLIDLHFIKRDVKEKLNVKPTARQLSIFGDVDEEIVNTELDGGADDEQ